MKTQKLITVFLLVQLFFAGMIFAQNGVIREISGTVELKRAGAAAFRQPE